jgi:hypothetical protein
LVKPVPPAVKFRPIAVKLVSFVKVSPPTPSVARPANRRVSVEVVVTEVVKVSELPCATLEMLTRDALLSPTTAIALAALAVTLGCVTVIVAPDASATVTGAVRVLHLVPLVPLPVRVDSCWV